MGIGQDKKRQIADSFGVNKLSISPVWDFFNVLLRCFTWIEVTETKLTSHIENENISCLKIPFYCMLNTLVLVFFASFYNLQTWEEES